MRSSVVAAEALAETLPSRSAEIEALRRLPTDIVASLAEAGLFRLLVPRVYGGGEAHPLELFESVEAVAKGDASVAWCLMIAATTGVTSAYLPPEQAKLVFGDPLSVTGGVFAPLGCAVVEGDQATVSGRWAWASGSAHCAWLMGGCVVHDASGPRKRADGSLDTRMFIALRAEVELIDTWFATGLKGTGSGDMAMNAVVIPFARSVSLSHDQPLAPGPLYAFPVFGLLALGIAGVAAGNALGALAAFEGLAGAKKPQGSSRSLAQRSAAQSEYAQARTMLLAARALVREAVDQAFAEAERGGGLSLLRRADLRLACAHLVRTSAEVCRRLYDLGGGSSVYEHSPLQRRFRDAHVATQHIMSAPAIFELGGRALLLGEGDWSTL
jgi:alkylation response protein AidB-like acyl-CoA dehydrogenase